MNKFRSKEEKRGSDGRDRETAGANLGGIVAALSILMVIAASVMVATATEPPTPFHAYGWVKYSNGTAVLGPNVNITNLNTGENYIVETNASYNYYQVITSSCNVSEGDVLYFNASDNGNSTNRTVTVTSQNMTDGGLFEQNLTIPVPQVGICGDVDGNEKVDSMDYVTLRAYVVGAPGWTITSEWAADVDCNGKIDSMDYVTLRAYIVGAPGWTLNCC